VVYSTHNVSEAGRHADRVLVLSEGRLLFDGTPAALSEAAPAGADGDLERVLVRFLDARAEPERQQEQDREAPA